MAKALIVEILADARQFGHELDKAAGKTKQMSKVAGVAGLAIAGGLAIGLEKSVKAAEEAQVSTAKLTTAFKASHDNIAKYSSAIDQAESSGRNLGFSNIEMRDSLGSLEIATHNGTKAIKDLGIAEDIARFKHIDLASASKMLTMAMAGSQRATKQLGLSVQAVTTAEDKVKAKFKDHTTEAYKAALATASLKDKMATSAQVIDLVKNKLHGQAQAFADTAQGGAARLRAQIEALEENLGAMLLPALTAVTGALANVTGWMARHTTVAKILVGALGALAAILLTVSAATKVQVAAMALARAATAAWTAAQWLLNAALAANPIGLVVIALAALGAALVIAWTKSKTFRNIVTGAWNDIKAVTLAVVGFLGPLVTGLIREWVSDFQTAKTVATHIWDGVRAIWNATLGGAIRDMIGLINKLIWIAEKAAAILHALASAAHTIGDVISGSGTRNLPPGVGPRGQGGPKPRLHAAGGIFTRPTRIGNDLFGESGPEALIPLSSPQAKGMLGSGVVVNVGPIYGTVDADFAQKLSTQLATQLRGGRAPQLQQAIRAI